MATDTTGRFDLDTFYQKIMQKGKEHFPNFELNEFDKEIYLMVYLYFYKDISFESFHHTYNLKKGLIVSGNIGVGKTVMFQIFKSIIKQNLYNEDFGIIKPYDLTRKYAMEGYSIIKSNADSCFFEINGVIDKRRPKSRLYDDLGSEELKSYYYGSRINVMEKILLKRYDLFMETGMKTYITTNLDGDEIEEFYGERVRSRLRQMTNSIYYSGTDRRR